MRRAHFVRCFDLGSVDGMGHPGQPAAVWNAYDVTLRECDWAHSCDDRVLNRLGRLAESLDGGAEAPDIAAGMTSSLRSN